MTTIVRYESLQAGAASYLFTWRMLTNDDQSLSKHLTCQRDFRVLKQHIERIWPELFHLMICTKLETRVIHRTDLTVALIQNERMCCNRGCT